MGQFGVVFLNIAGSVTLMVMCLVWSSCAELQRFEHAGKADGSLSFLVVGDWGRRGAYNQSQVALQMGVIGEELDIDFVISTGDNFYDNGLEGTHDPAFHYSFTNIYTAPSLHKPWYTVLGNHDYRGDAVAQLSPVLTTLDNRWVCLRSYIVDAEVAELFFVDTTPFVEKYFTEPEDHIYDWRGVLPRQEYISNLLKDVEWALKESKAKWKIVVGHHGIRSAGVHGDTEELVKVLLPILEENKVDVYMNGHDHCLQHISSLESGIQFLTSGGGSKAWRGVVRQWKPQEMKLYHDGQGFMSLHLTHSHLHLAFYDVFGNLLHQWTTSSSSKHSII